ncbi:response regulator [Pseudodesulfovibrio sp. zrk46]|uniref:response regulator n=1 Tax=Pseudodesulfovibrio sp. zrk46 TaxID=2725288 RepID=UPI001448F607|nr:response regulator [Pseudodesulfovibrio sp. zrk46]QJB57452.1 response regulator [Pseudodesulfovibrio sp. zrk46]
MNGVNVLHIDDETGFSASVGRRLIRRGMNCHSAASGPEALDILAREDVDVVLLDIKMPGMDGIKTLGSIKKEHPMIEVIMLTGHADTDIVISSLAMGAYDYLIKPVEIGIIMRKIEDAAERRKRNLEQGAR